MHGILRRAVFFLMEVRIPMHEKRLAARYFMLSFAVGFLILSVAAMMAVLLIPPGMASAETPENRISGSYLPTNGDALTLLVLIDEENAPLILLRFDPVRGQIPVTALPFGTLVGEKGSAVPVGTLYRTAGPGSAAAALEKTLGIEIDRRAQLDGGDVIRLADLLGGVHYQLREPVETAGQRLDPGNYLLSGTLFYELMNYSGYRGGERSRCTAAAKLWTELINQNMDDVLSDETEGMSAQIMGMIRTDLSALDVQQRESAAEFMAQLMGEAAFAVEIDGTDMPEIGAYDLSEISRSQIAGIYSPA